MRIYRPTPRKLDSVGPGWYPEICLLADIPGGFHASSLDHMLLNSILETLL